MPVRLTVKMRGGGAERLREAAKRLPDQLAAATAETAEHAEQRLKENAPVSKKVPGGRKPGGLRESIRFDLSGTQATFMASQVSEYVIAGTPAHEIQPRNARALRFWWEDAGGFVNLMRVRHPGTQANDFRVPALEQAAGDAEDVLAELADTIAEGLGS